MDHSMDRGQKTSKKLEAVTTLPFWRQLRGTLIVSLILFAIIPVLFTLTIILSQIDVQMRQQVEQQLESVAELKIDQIELWLDDSQSILALILANPTTNDQVFSFLTQVSNHELSNEQIQQHPTSELLRRKIATQTTFEEFFIYTRRGQVIASSDSDQIGGFVTNQHYFLDSLDAPIIQSPYYELGRDELTMLVTLPLVEPTTNETVGVIAGRLSLDTLGEIMTERRGLGDSGETYLVSPDNNYLVTPSRFEAEGYTLNQTYRSAGIDRALNGENGTDTYLDYRDPAVPVIGVYRWLPQLQVAMLAEVDEAEALSLFDQVRNLSSVLIGVTILIAIGIGLYVAVRITRPITALTQVAIRISQGDFRQQANINRRNEIGVLATAFNTMTGQLRELIDSLEEQVAARTQGLEIVATLSERLGAILNVNELSEAIVNQIQAEFGYYHAHIYLLDDEGQQLVVAEGTGIAGAEMKAKRHSIALDAHTSLVARAARTGQVVRVDNVREAEDWLPNPLLPHTYAEMAVPIILEGQVVGVLDVQENKVAGLDEGDEGVLRSLANQIAVAIRNAQFFERIETALAETQVAQERYTIQSWEKVKQSSGEKQHVYARPDVAPVHKSKQQFMDEIYRQTLNQVQPTMLTSTDEQNTFLATPITLNDQIIGALQIHADHNRQTWSDKDIAFIQAVVDQFAQIAENLRLFDETRKRAGRQKLLADVGDRLRRANDMESLMKLGIEEISRVLGARQAFVRLGSEAELVDARPALSVPSNGHEDPSANGPSPSEAEPEE